MNVLLCRCDVDGSAPSRHLVVVAIDFGTTYSGYAFSFAHDARRSTDSQILSVSTLLRWSVVQPLLFVRVTTLPGKSWKVMKSHLE